MKKAYLLAMIGAVAICITGCMAGKFGTVVKPEQKAKIVKGTTTKVEILKELGNPDQTIDLGDGKQQLSYISEQVSFSPVAVFQENAGSKFTEFWITFDKGVVTEFGEKPTSKAPNYMK